MARQLARQFEAEERAANAQARSGDDGQQHMAAHAILAAATAGLPAEALLAVPGLQEFLLLQQLQGGGEGAFPNFMALGHGGPPAAAEVDQRPEAPSEDQIRRLPTRRATGHLLQEECSVCTLNYEEGEELRTLPCLHTFHAECIDKWLTSRRASSLTCPICHTEVRF